MYTDIINTGPIPRMKIKMPLKIKVFIWFVHKGAILSKDNLAKHSREGNKRFLVISMKQIEHFSIKCPLSKLLWRTIHVAFNVIPPVTFPHLFRTWLAGVESKTAAHIRVGICALLWAI